MSGQYTGVQTLIQAYFSKADITFMSKKCLCLNNTTSMLHYINNLALYLLKHDLAPTFYNI